MESRWTVRLWPSCLRKSECHEAPTPSDLSLPPSTGSLEFNKQPLELPPLVLERLQEEGLEANEFGTVIWSHNCRTHPREWPLARKSFDSAVICFLEFFMTLISNTGSSLAVEASRDFHIGRAAAVASFTATYMVGQGLGGLIFPPLAESFGGRSIYIASTAIYAVCHIAMGLCPTLPVIIVLRFISGALSSIPAVVATGTLENMWDSKARIYMIHCWIIAAVLGVMVGPVVATNVADTPFGWTLMFYIAAGISGPFSFACIGMRESRPSKLLSDRVKAIARQTDFQSLTVDETDSIPNLRTFMRTSLALPVKLFITEPVVLITSIMAATVYGIGYLFAEAFSMIYAVDFGFTLRHAALVMLSLAIGVVPTFLLRAYDIRVANQRRKQNRIPEPEDKLTGFFIAAPILAAGLWWFALTIPPLANTSPWVSIVSLVFFGFAVVEFDTVLSGYLTDTYASNAASANAPMSFLRCILSGGLPVAGKAMFEKMGNNNALCILASVATAFCGVAVWFKMTGKQQRLRSPFAEKTRVTVMGEEDHAGLVPMQDVPEADAGNRKV